MASPSSSLPSEIAARPAPSFKLLPLLAEFVIRRRILLSGILFVLIVVNDVAFGAKPHDLADFRDPLTVLGGSLVLGGLALRSWAVGILRKDSELTTTGPYRLIRNPLYVGSFLMMFGFCALLNDPHNIWFILGPILLIYIVKVRQEERLLAGKFPAQWRAYAGTTPRFFPRIAGVSLAADWRASQWMRSREYQALGATLLALVALKVWHVI
jgi:protein-S-isoprenylcysteine O-methyltransferase Ste14